jgi:solute carrier family 25 phosphate transporter 23/24/25/41
MSYYTSAITINSEGDTSISDDTLEGLGTNQTFLSLLFGAIIRITESPVQRTSTANLPTSSDMAAAARASANATIHEASASFREGAQGLKEALSTSAQEVASRADQSVEVVLLEDVELAKKFSLTELFPDPGMLFTGISS